MFSRAVRVSSRLESWKMKPSCSRRKRVSLSCFSRVTSAPLITTLPLVTVSMVDTQLSSVDLPEPDAPMMPTNLSLIHICRGTYDRYLPQLRDDCLLVGVAFAEQEVEQVPCDEHDHKIERFVTA